MYRIKNIMVLAAASVMALNLCGCGSVEKIRSEASDIRVDRAAYLALKNGNVKQKDISSVLSFMNTLNTVLGENAVSDFTTSYDADSETVYVMSKDANIAFRLDENGDVLFASASGAPEVKEALTRGIAEVTIGIGKSNELDALYDKIEETRWLNTINSNVVMKQAQGLSISPLDTTLMSVPDLQVEALDTTLQMPVFTETLQSAGLDDLSDYYESPSLDKFWSDADISSVKDDIADIESKGKSLKDTYESYKLPSPDSDVDKWDLDDYSLPSEYSDGTATDGTAAAGALEQFQNELSDWQTELESNYAENKQEAQGSLPS